VPAGASAESETVGALVDRLHEAINHLAGKGVPLDALLKAGMISPSCGLGSLTPVIAERVFELTVGVSAEMRHRYTVSSVAEPPRAAVG